MNGWQRWVQRCTAREGATSLALFRIGVGLCVLLSIGSVVAAGLVQPLWIDRAHGGMRTLAHPSWLVALLGGATPAVIWSLVGASLAGAGALVVGVGGRPVALLTALAATNLVDVNGHAGGSYDELMANALWLVFLGGGEQTLSLRARWATGQWWPEAHAFAFPRWLGIWQLCLMYGTTGLQKVSAYWVPGGDASALYYILQQPTWHRADMSWLAWWFPLTQVATTVTWLWEVTAFSWILWVYLGEHPDRGGRLGRWARRLHLAEAYALVGLGMHLAIFVTMEVGPFSPLSLAFYPLLVAPAAWRRLQRRWGRSEEGVGGAHAHRGAATGRDRRADDPAPG
jgi:hypothetical protein